MHRCVCPGGGCRCRSENRNLSRIQKYEVQVKSGIFAQIAFIIISSSKFALKQNVQFPSLVQEYKVPTPADIPLHHSLNPQVEPSKNLNQSFCHPDHHNHEIL